MSMAVSYTLRFEGEEAELVEKLRRVRGRAEDLPIWKTDGPIRVAPVVNPLVLRMVEGLDLPIPEPVRSRLQGIRDDREMMMHCVTLDLTLGLQDHPDLYEKWMEPAIAMVEEGEHWNAGDYPAWIREGYRKSEGFRSGFRLEALDREEEDFCGFGMNRQAILGFFAKVLLSVGHILYLGPGEGCEPVTAGLATLSRGGPSLWLGQGFTKTHYAKDVARAHSNVVTLLDLLQEEGLLLDADDPTGYYEHRDWPRARRRIAAELAVLGAVSGSVEGMLRKTFKVREDAPIEKVVDNAGKAFDRLRDMGATPDEVLQGLDELREKSPDP